jgi:hypothetical protein
MDIFKLPQPLNISTVKLLYVHCKGKKEENLIEKTIPHSVCFKKYIQNLKFENYQDYAWKPQQKLCVHELDFCISFRTSSKNFLKNPRGINRPSV